MLRLFFPSPFSYPDGNLYVGTSESELLHFVQIPPDLSDPLSRPSFILASRLEPPFASLPDQAPLPGVQQVVLLPAVSKAAVLCNYTVTFYSLPELSPTTKSVQVKNVCWIGGLDLDERQDMGGGDTLMLALSKRLRVIRLRDDDARVVRVSEGSLDDLIGREEMCTHIHTHAYTNNLDHRFWSQYECHAPRHHCLCCRLAKLCSPRH